MKRAVLLHGTGGSNIDYFWFADTKKYLENKGYELWWPLLPHTEKPNLVESLGYLADNYLYEDIGETIFIAHSSGCPLLLMFLQYFSQPVKQAVLVSGFYQSIDDEGISELMLPVSGFKYGATKAAAKEVVLINSDNDPWGCDDKQARPVAEALGAKFVLAKGQGHMGSGTFNQPYREFPLLKNLLLV
jgi:predicted alpha/beta hydrolase family esterase